MAEYSANGGALGGSKGYVDKDPGQAKLTPSTTSLDRHRIRCLITYAHISHLSETAKINSIRSLAILHPTSVELFHPPSRNNSPPRMSLLLRLTWAGAAILC